MTITGFFTGFIASMVGWQINVLSAERGMRRGRTAAFMVGFGAVIADSILIFFAMSGTKPLSSHPEWWQGLRWVGILTVLALALRLFLRHPAMPGEVKRLPRNPARNFLAGFIVVVSNPAVFLLWIGVIGFILTHVPADHFGHFRVKFLAGFLVGGSLWFLLFARVFLKHLRTWIESRLSVMTKITALMLIGVAIFLIFERF